MSLSEAHAARTVSAARSRSARAAHLLHHGFSRRTFLRGAAGVTGATVGANLLRTTAALADDCAPKPIEGGTDIPGLGFFHFFPPGPGLDPSVITDFRGRVGIAIVRGRWAGRDVKTGERIDTERPAFWESDMRFMEGEIVGLDGRRCRGAFAFV